MHIIRFFHNINNPIHSFSGKRLIVFAVLPLALFAFLLNLMSRRPRVLPVQHGAKSLVFSADSKLIAVGEIGQSNIWDVKTGKLVKNLDLDGGRQQGSDTNIIGSMAFSSDNSLLACSLTARYVVLWDWRNSKMKKILPTYSMYSVSALSFFSDGKTLGAAIDNGQVQLWNINTWQPTSPLTGRYDTTVRTAFSSGGGIFARCEGNQIQLYESNTAKLKDIITANGWGIMAIALSADGKWLASNGRDKTLRVWNLQNGKMTYSWPSVSEFLALSNDGAIVSDGFQVWEVQSGKIKRKLSRYGNLELLAISPDGSLLARGDATYVELVRL